MSYFSKFTKLVVVPVKKCLSFEKDPCFTKAKQTLIDTGIQNLFGTPLNNVFIL